jgi:hypothetical protein
MKTYTITITAAQLTALNTLVSAEQTRAYDSAMMQSKNGHLAQAYRDRGDLMAGLIAALNARPANINET